jgi:hypothetical protein
MDATFITEACCLITTDVLGLLQHLLEWTAFPLLVAMHCLGTPEALAALQQLLEYACHFPFGLALRRFSDPVLPHSQQESR